MTGLADRWRDLAAERGRTMLVVLGVLWGTLSLTVLLAFGGSLDDAMHDASRNGGVDVVRFLAGSTSRPHRGVPAGRPMQRTTCRTK